MNVDNWIKLASLVEDLIKTIIPFGAIFFILWLFKQEIKTVIKNGGMKLTGPGFSVETSKQQQEKVNKKEKKEIQALNKELATTKQVQQKLQELQSYTSRDKDVFFLGYHFEKTYRAIFSSQMLILTEMDQQNGEIIDTLAHDIFKKTVWDQQFHIPYENFMGFLIGAGMIRNDVINKKYLINPIGKMFLQYLRNNNIPFKLPPNDMVQSG